MEVAEVAEKQQAGLRPAPRQLGGLLARAGERAIAAVGV
jgi:hypothetical protein